MNDHSDIKTSFSLYFDSSNARASHLLALRSGVCLRAKIGSSRAGLREEAREDWLKERAEDKLSAASLWKGHPEDEDELEDVVKGWYRVSQSPGGTE